jgi:hypothetical protein
VAEVAFEGVAVDHDPVLVAFPRNAVPVVLPVRMHLGTAVRDDHRDVCEHLLEFLRQAVDRVSDQRFEPILILEGHLQPRMT